MLFELPPKRYTAYPADLIGRKRPVFRDKKGHYASFNRQKTLTLVLPFKSELEAVAAYTDFLSTLPRKKPAPKKPARKENRKQKPKVKSAAKPVTKPKVKPKAKPVIKPKVKPKPVTKPKAKPKVKPAAKPVTKPKVKPKAKPVSKPKPTPAAKPPAKPKVKPAWVSTGEVLERLERKYDDIDFDERSRDFTGNYYDVKKDPWHGTIWSKPEINPKMKMRSVFFFVVLEVSEASGDNDNKHYVFAGRGIGWQTTPEWIMRHLSEKGVSDRLDDGTIVSRSKLENFLDIIFKVRPGRVDIIEIVGTKFSLKKTAPPPDKRQTYEINPHKKKK